MSIVSFIREAGEKLFGRKESEPAAAAAPDRDENKIAADAIKQYIESQGLKVEGLQVAFDGASATVTVSGQAPDQATKEKVVLCCGNVRGVSKVEDRITVPQAAQKEARFHTVEKGDTLSKIAKQAYGDANAYTKIFDANKPMLKDPDKIYPGQLLRIPA